MNASVDNTPLMTNFWKMTLDNCYRKVISQINETMEGKLVKYWTTRGFNRGICTNCRNSAMRIDVGTGFELY